MNDNAKKWVAALRSGEYKQGTGQLAGLYKGGYKYCCLGVLCEVYQKEVGGLIVEEKYRKKSYSGYALVLPPIVQEWVGLRTEEGNFHDGETLSFENDNGQTFEEIASLIESEPEGLFVAGGNW